MKRVNHSFRTTYSNRQGFTLVEMLVAVTLILLMMTLFASIFSMATDSMNKQRGIAEHDQRVRRLTTLLRADFQHRTMRYPLPFFPGEDSATSPSPFGNRAGYLYISTNQPDSGLDDKVQFTTNSDITFENLDATPNFGRGELLGDRTGVTAPGLAISPNQPDADDGSLSPNGTGSSTVQEVVIFVRNGNLIRRTQLARRPLEVAGRDFGPQPTTSRGYDLFSGLDASSSYDGRFQIASGLSNNFWRHFDYCAKASGLGGNQSTQFLGVDALSNELTSSGAPTDAFGVPVNRFGFNQLTGLSREHTSLAVPLFIGGYTQAETSARNFNWPQGLARVDQVAADDSGDNSWPLLGNGNPFDIINTPVTLNGSGGIVNEFSESASGLGRGGPRHVEDLLLPNVHEMRVEIWDDRLSRFVTPGHFSLNPATGEMGDYHSARRLNANVGPWGSGADFGLHRNCVFDSWHPAANVDLNADGTLELNSEPPFIAYAYYPPAMPNGPTPAAATGPFATTRVAGNQYSTEDLNANNVLDPGEDANGNGKLDFSVVVPPYFDRDGDTNFTPGNREYPPGNGYQIAYKCVGFNDNADGDGNFGESAGVPLNASAPGRLITDGEVIWESIDNRRPLKALRLQIRFMDQKTDTMRQLSLIVPLTDEER